VTGGNSTEAPQCGVVGTPLFLFGIEGFLILIAGFGVSLAHFSQRKALESNCSLQCDDRDHGA